MMPYQQIVRVPWEDLEMIPKLPPGVKILDIRVIRARYGLPEFDTCIPEGAQRYFGIDLKVEGEFSSYVPEGGILMYEEIDQFILRYNKLMLEFARIGRTHAMVPGGNSPDDS
jgi:hypothetical protein